MKNIGFIWKREVRAYFTTIVAYIVVTLFLLMAGALFWLGFFNEFTILSLRSFFQQAPLFLALFAPAVTMGLLSTEKRDGTLELMMTMPVSDFQIVLGKFLAACTLLFVVLLMTSPYAYTLSRLGDFDWGATLAGYAGLMLLASTYAAIGLMTSSWTRHQVIAVLLAFYICLILYILGQFVGLAEQVFGGGAATIATVMQYASTSYHFENFARGVIDLRDVIYYVSMIAVCLVVAQASIASRRW